MSTRQSRMGLIVPMMHNDPRSLALRPWRHMATEGHRGVECSAIVSRPNSAAKGTRPAQ
jgi:hypothetical protein